MATGQYTQFPIQWESINLANLGISNDVKTALLQIAQKVAYIDDEGATYYQALYDALYPSVTYTITNTLTGCTSSNAAASIADGDPYTATITASSGYSLTGATVSITMGGSDITATAYTAGTISIASVTGDLSITITAAAATLSSISAVYTQSGTVYDTDSLDSLKSDLVVTATWSDTSTSIVASADYTLSGSLTAGTSTITVTYQSKTTTFTVTVTSGMLYSLYNQTLAKGQYGINTNIKLLENDIDFTILFDGTHTAYGTTDGERYFNCLHPSSPYKGVYVGSDSALTNAQTLAQWWYASGTIQFGRTSSGRIRVLYTHTAGESSATVKYKSSGDVVTIPLSNAVSSHSGYLTVGGTTGSTTNTWVGTITKFEVLNHIISQSDIDAFFGD